MFYLIKVYLLTGKVLLILSKNTKDILSNFPSAMYENIDEIKVRSLGDIANKTFIGLGVFQTELNGLSEEDFFV